MVFLIQNTQNRDARAINLKLNELIRAVDKARDQMIDIEKLSDLELDELHIRYEDKSRVRGLTRIGCFQRCRKVVPSTMVTNMTTMYCSWRPSACKQVRTKFIGWLDWPPPTLHTPLDLGGRPSAKAA
jgi:hypothetical protein